MKYVDTSKLSVREIDRKIANIIKKVNMSKLPVCSIDYHRA